MIPSLFALGFGILFLILLLCALVLFLFVFWILMIVDCAQRSFKKPGDRVNLECDLLGKYVEGLILRKGKDRY